MIAVIESSVVANEVGQEFYIEFYPACYPDAISLAGPYTSRKEANVDVNRISENYGSQFIKLGSGQFAVEANRDYKYRVIPATAVKYRNLVSAVVAQENDCRSDNLVEIDFDKVRSPKLLDWREKAICRYEKKWFSVSRV